MKKEQDINISQHPSDANPWKSIIIYSLSAGALCAMLFVVFVIVIDFNDMIDSSSLIGRHVNRAILIFTGVAGIIFVIKALLYTEETNQWLRLMQSSLRISVILTLAWMLVIGISKYQQLIKGYGLSNYLSNATYNFIFIFVIAFIIKTVLHFVKGSGSGKANRSYSIVENALGNCAASDALKKLSDNKNLDFEIGLITRAIKENNTEAKLSKYIAELINKSFDSDFESDDFSDVAKYIIENTATN